ncbi:MAG TPA: SHOCT domain-containing protein [Burkholderiales bacterium]|nr:SHOCT domain-containing protein [Burkholderiales bacterium]
MNFSVVGAGGLDADQTVRRAEWLLFDHLHGESAMWAFHDGWWGWTGMHLFPGATIWLLFLVLLVLVLLGSRRGPSPEETALEILNKRYARGDIGREEYVRTRGDLTG